MTLVSQRQDSLSQGLRYNYAVISEQDPVREGKFVSRRIERAKVFIPGA